MIDRRLLGAVLRVGRWVALSVAAQWADLVANVALVLAASGVLGAPASGVGAATVRAAVLRVPLAAVVAAVVRLAGLVVRSRAAYRSSRAVKREPRTRIYRKLLRLGPGYREVAPSSEVVQMATEGVEQLETYFASYLPQLAYTLAQCGFREEALNAIANLGGMVMSFLGEAWVPLSLMGANVQAVAHFTPTFWMYDAVTCALGAQEVNASVLATVAIDLGIIALFAVAIVSAGLVAARLRARGLTHLDAGTVPTSR